MESVLKFITNSEISPDELDATIKNIDDLNSLNALLDIKIRYMTTCSEHYKINFDLSFIYANETENIDLKCEVLKKALLVSGDPDFALLKITTYINEKYNDLNHKFKITRLLHSLIIFCNEEKKMDILFLHFKPEFVNSFLLDGLLKEETRIDAYETLRYYFAILTSADKIKCLNAMILFSYQNNNLDVLCAVLNFASEDILENKECCFTSDKFWIYLETCISGTEAYLQKQAEFVLLKCVKILKKKTTNYYLIVSGDVDSTWEAFFMLLDIGREKQLHLVEPALDIIKYVHNLPPLWQNCIYKIYLRHSQSSIVYQTAIHILNQTYKDDNLRDILRLLLPAINKHEYSELSCEMFKTFHSFCLNLNKKDFNILLEEILLVSWNPISFWKITQNVFIPENKMQIYVDYFIEIIRCAASLPHVYLRSQCIQYLIHFFWDKNSFFKMYKIVCALQKNNIDYSKYCPGCVFSQEIIDFVINELLNSNENNDIEKAKVCIIFLSQLVSDVLPAPISKYFNKYSPHVKLFLWGIYFYAFADIAEQSVTFYRQIEQFLIQYFIEYLQEDTIESFLQLFGCLVRPDTFIPKYAAKKVIDAVFNPDNYNKNQIHVAFELLSTFLGVPMCDENIEKVGQTVIENWRNKILKENSEKICNEYINLIFAVNFDGFSSENTSFTIKIFTSMFECQNNEVLDCIYEKTHTLLYLSESEELVIDFIDVCHENLKTIKKDQYFKGIVDKFIQIVHSPIYISVNIKNIPRINKTLLELSEAHPVIRLNWIRAIHKLFTDGFKYFHYFLTPTVDIYLQGLITTKDARTEFKVCQEFLQDTRSTERAYNPWQLCESSNPNLLHAASRILALEVLLQIAQGDTDLVVNCLREKYLTFFKKRYFPGSEIHFQKLRITQAIMLLIPYVQQTVRTTRQISVFAYDCFLEEANQNCIKQLFNWILILLLKVQGFAVIEYIRRITTQASASVSVGLVPAVYHLTVLGNEEAFHETIKLALPWTMGAQFKLRVYAQDLIRRLFKHARQKEYTDFLQKYKHLEECIDTCIKSTGEVFENTMKADLLFLNDFDLVDDNSLKTIFYDIPRLNKVCSTEWQNIDFYLSRPEYLKESQILYERTPINSQSTLFSDAIDTFLCKDKCINKQSEIPEIQTLNIQKKITPWKIALEDEDCKVKSNFILIASLIDKPQNLGGLSRTCEVFGIRSLVLNDAKVVKDKDFRSLSMSSENWVNAIEVKVKNLEEYISKCQAEGYYVVGAEQTACSVKLNEFRFPQKTALILGHEKTGIPPNLIPVLNACLEIPQFGQVRSLNVHVAGATFIWEYAKQHLV